MRVALFVSGVLLLVGCQAGGSPHLIELTELSPHRLGPGERLELHGRGFPEGRRARVTFQGELARAGQSSERHVEISAFAETSSPHTLTVEFDRRLEQEFCGLESPQHTTFHGSVEAAFAPRNAGAPPVTGELYEVTFDVVPQVSLEQVELAAGEGQRYAEFLGLLAEQDGRGVSIKGVMPRSRAESAGVVAGDVLTELDGVRVFGFEDLLPEESAARSRLLVRRSSQSEPIALAVDSAGFRPKSTKKLVPALGLVALFATLAFLLRTRFGALFTWLERRVAARLKNERVRGSAAGFEQTLGALSQELPRGVGPYFGMLLAVAAFAVMAMGRELVAAELDLPVAAVAAFTALALSSLIDPGRPRASFGQRLRLLGAVFVQQLTLVLAASSAALGARSTRAFDLVAAQGAAPWAYGAFASPLALTAFVVFVATLVPRASRQAELAGPLGSGPLLACAEWTSLMISCAFGALIFLGGFRLPWVSLASPSPWLQALGALFWCAKALGLFGLVLGLRAVLGRFDAAQAFSLIARGLLPAALGTLGLRASWLVWGQKSALAAAAPGLGYASFAAFCLLLALIAARVAQQLRRGAYEPSVSPWL